MFATPALSLLILLQAPATPGAAAAITPQDIRQRIGILADDSMRGRDTPSAELDETAAWVAQQFRRLGLRPGGEGDSYFQRYPLVRRALDRTRTSLSAARNGAPLADLVGDEVEILEPGVADSGAIAGPAVMIDRDPPDRSMRNAWLIQTAQPGLAVAYAAARRALAVVAVGVLLVSSAPDVDRRALLDAGPSAWQVEERPGNRARDRFPAIVEIRRAAAARLFASGPDGLVLTLRVSRRTVARATAPNTIGVLPGRDPVLAREYVFVTAHMDHIGVASDSNPGCPARGGDSICNGADDNASGTVAVIEAAEAFTRQNPRPRRSIVFMTVSGEEKGLWGSSYFTAHPLVPLDAIVADLNIDMVGRNWRDTIAVIGGERSTLGPLLHEVAAAHPELDITPIRDPWPAEDFYHRSDHFNFARLGIPVLFFFNGTHADYHQPSDEVAKIDAEKESRIAKLVFYVALTIADRSERPRWN